MSTILTSRAAMDVAQAVDRYRHQNYAAEQILKQYTSRKDMEKALIDFYRRQGITDVSADMIREVIEEYERQRFTHQLPKMSLFKRVMARSYINLWRIDYGFTGGLLLVLGIAYFPVVMLLSGEAPHSSDVMAGAEKPVVEQRVISAEEHQALIDQGQQFIQKVQELSSTLPGEGQKATHEALMAMLSSLVVQQEHISSLVNQPLISERIELYQAINEAESLLSRFNALREVGDRYQDLMQSGKIDGALQYPSMRSLQAQLMMAFASGDADHAEKSIVAMTTLASGIESSKVLMATIEKQVSDSRDAFKDQAGIDRLDRLVQQARSATEDGDVQTMKKVSAQVLALYTFVGSKLAVRIHDEPGNASVFYKEEVDAFGFTVPRSRHYFVVLEMVNTDGVVQPVEIRDAESRVAETVTQWGQEITQASYEQLRDDKLANKRVTELEYGVKERGYYDYILTRPHQNRTITQW